MIYNQITFDPVVHEVNSLWIDLVIYFNGISFFHLMEWWDNFKQRWLCFTVK